MKFKSTPEVNEPAPEVGRPDAVTAHFEANEVLLERVDAYYITG